MNINNSQYRTNKFFPTKQNITNDTTSLSNTSIFFRGKLVTKQIALNSESYNALKNLSSTYENITRVISKHNTSDTKQIKDEFPNLLSYKNLKGLTFDKFGINKDKRIQIVRFNSKESSDELITINILDKNNNNILKCRTTKDGVASLNYDEDNAKLLNSKYFTQNKNSKKILDNIIKTFESLKFYLENLSKVRRNIRNNDEELSVLDSISKIQALQNSNGIKDEISKTYSAYTEVSDLLNETKGKDSFILKSEYFGNDYNLKNKGLDFSNLIQNSLSICPLKSKNDNRIFRIIAQNGKELKAFVFYDDGKVSQQKTFDLGTNGFRPNNLIYITDKEIGLFKLSSVLKEINQELEKFKQFIKGFREAKIIAKEDKKTERINKEEERKILKHNESLKLKENKRLEKEAKKLLNQELKEKQKLEKQKEKEQQRLQQKLEQEKLKAEREARKLEQDKIKNQKQIEKEKLKAEREARKLEQDKIKKQKQLERENLKAKREAEKIEQAQFKKFQKMEKAKLKAELKAKKLEQKNLISFETSENDNIKTKKYDEIFKNNISYLKISDVIERLNELFATPVEERSSHLKHKKLSNGKYFNGQFSLQSADGANITVSRVKSPKYVEFTYYSINIDKNGKNTTINIDPTRNGIIKSENGKPVIINGVTIKYIGLQKLVQQEPFLNELPKYLNEIFIK